jgi:hypothetical protein
MQQEGHDGTEAMRRELIAAIEELGFPGEFGEVLAHELGGAWSMRRMIGYLRGACPTSPEQIADEMLAILEQRRAIVERKMGERANAAVTTFYNRPRDE